MYTTQKTPLAKLRAYDQELTTRYLQAIRRHDLEEAHRLYDLRRRVRREVLVRQEWGESILPESVAVAA